MKSENTTSVLWLFLKRLKAPVTRCFVESSIEKHPERTSLFAISDVLSSLKIAHEAFRIGIEHIEQMPMPFIAHLAVNRSSEFVVVESITNEHFVVSNDSFTRYKMPVEQFKDFFSGNVLAAELTPGCGEPGYDKARRRELLNSIRYPVLAICIGVLLVPGMYFMHYINGYALETGLLIALNIAGVSVAGLLLMYLIDSKNSFINQICTNGKKMDCMSILTSKSASVIEGLSWSEIGFFYFSGALLSLLFNQNSLAIMQLLAVLNILTLPYTVYSVYYQWVVAKKWCVLCCCIQALLWLCFFCYLPFIGFTRFLSPPRSVFSYCLFCCTCNYMVSGKRIAY